MSATTIDKEGTLPELLLWSGEKFEKQRFEELLQNLAKLADRKHIRYCRRLLNFTLESKKN